MENNNLLLSLWQARHQFDVVQLLLPWCSKLPSPPKTTNEFWFLFIKCIINSSSCFLFVFPSRSLVPELEDPRVFPCGFAASGSFCSNFNIIPQNSMLFPSSHWQVHGREILELQIFSCGNYHRLSAGCILSPVYKDITIEEFSLFAFIVKTQLKAAHLVFSGISWIPLACSVIEVSFGV